MHRAHILENSKLHVVGTSRGTKRGRGDRKDAYIPLGYYFRDAFSRL